MKESERKLLNSTCQSVIHYIFITTFLILIITLPILYTKTGTPPYWVICLIVGVFLLFYILFMVCVLTANEFLKFQTNDFFCSHCSTFVEKNTYLTTMWNMINKIKTRLYVYKIIVIVFKVNQRLYTIPRPLVFHQALFLPQLYRLPYDLLV